MKDADEIVISLRRIMRATEMYSQKLKRESGLTVPQLLLMQGIEKDGSPSPSMLARHIVVSQATVTRIIDRLEVSGLVRREKCSEDKRVVSISLTDVGREKLSCAPEALQADFYQKFRELEDWEQQMLRSSLARIARMMDADGLDVAPILQAGAVDAP